MISFVLNFFQYDNDNKQESYAKLFWFVKLRWLAIIILFLFSVPLLLSGFLTRNSFPIYIAILGLLMLLNFFIQVLFIKAKNQVSDVFVSTQFYIDYLALFSLIYLCGGIFNPIVIFLFINTCLAALLLSQEHKKYFLIFLIFTSSFLINSSWQEKGKLFLEKDIWFICSFLFLLFSLWFIMDIIGRFVNIQNQKKIRSLVKQEKNDRLRALGALASGFSHEFASPLNAVKLTIERLKQSIASGNYYEDLLMASKAIDSCEFVLKQMNASQMDPQSSLFKKVDMKMFLNDVCDSWLEVHPGCFFEKSIEHQYCEIPIVHFAQTVINLLDNAYESNPNGKIALNFMKKEEYFHLIVIDDGPGFPKEILSKIGEPFLTSKINGTGLGIYVSELLAQSLSGELCIKNKKTEDGALVNLLWPCSNGNG